jgi:hypothetical protein
MQYTTVSTTVMRTLLSDESVFESFDRLGLIIQVPVTPELKAAGDLIGVSEGYKPLDYICWNLKE